MDRQVTFLPIPGFQDAEKAFFEKGLNLMLCLLGRFELYKRLSEDGNKPNADNPATKINRLEKVPSCVL